MPFDPDAFIKSHTKQPIFDPDAFLDAHGESGFDPDVFIGKHTGQPVSAPTALLEQPTAEQTPMGQTVPGLAPQTVLPPVGIGERVRRAGEEIGGPEIPGFVATLAKTSPLNWWTNRQDLAYASRYGNLDTGKAEIEKLSDFRLGNQLYMNPLSDINIRKLASRFMVSGARNEPERLGARETLHQLSKQYATPVKAWQKERVERDETIPATAVLGAHEMTPYMVSMALGPLGFTAAEAVTRFGELRAGQFNIDEKGQLRLSKEGAEVFESLVKAAGGAAITRYIEMGSFPAGRLLSKIPGAKTLRQTGGKLVPSQIRALAAKIKLLKGKVPRVPAVSKAWRALNRAIGFQGLGREILGEEAAEAFVNGLGNLQNEYNKVGLQNLPDAAITFAKQVPDMALSMSVLRGGQYALSVPGYLAGNANRKRDIEKALRAFGVPDSEISSMSTDDRIDKLNDLFNDTITDEQAADIAEVASQTSELVSPVRPAEEKARIGEPPDPTLTALDPYGDPYITVFSGEDWATLTRAQRQNVIDEDLWASQTEVQEERLKQQAEEEELAEYKRLTSLYDNAVAKTEKEIESQGFAVQGKRGWSDSSRYIDVADAEGEYVGTVRISDHEQPVGGGFSEEQQERVGEADVNLPMDTEKGEIELDPLHHWLVALQGETVDVEAKKEAKPTAEFVGMQERPGGGEPFALFTIHGGERDGSTVAAETLEGLGIAVPEISEQVSEKKPWEMTQEEFGIYEKGKIAQYGGRDKWLSSDEYKEIYPNLAKVRDKERKEYFEGRATLGKKETIKAGLKNGDRVEAVVPDITGAGAVISGTLYFTKKGIPRVKLDDPGLIAGGRKYINWHKGWAAIVPISVPEGKRPAEPEKAVPEAELAPPALVPEEAMPPEAPLPEAVLKNRALGVLGRRWTSMRGKGWRVREYDGRKVTESDAFGPLTGGKISQLHEAGIDLVAPIVPTEKPKRKVRPRAEQEWDVTLRQIVTVGPRKVPEDVDRHFTVSAKTAFGAEQAVRNAGHKGIFVSAEIVSEEPTAQPKRVRKPRKLPKGKEVNEPLRLFRAEMRQSGIQPPTGLNIVDDFGGRLPPGIWQRGGVFAWDTALARARDLGLPVTDNPDPSELRPLFVGSTIMDVGAEAKVTGEGFIERVPRQPTHEINETELNIGDLLYFQGEWRRVTDAGDRGGKDLTDDDTVHVADFESLNVKEVIRADNPLYPYALEEFQRQQAEIAAAEKKKPARASVERYAEPIRPRKVQARKTAEPTEAERLEKAHARGELFDTGKADADLFDVRDFEGPAEVPEGVVSAKPTLAEKGVAPKPAPAVEAQGELFRLDISLDEAAKQAVDLYGDKERAVDALTRQRAVLEQNKESTKRVDDIIGQLRAEPKEAYEETVEPKPGEQGLVKEPKKDYQSAVKPFIIDEKEPEYVPQETLADALQAADLAAERARGVLPAKRAARRRVTPRTGGVVTLGTRITDTLARKGRIDLRGQTFADIGELAALLQVYRDPRIETFRIIYVKGDRIVAHEGMTAGLPGLTVARPSTHKPSASLRHFAAMKRRIERLGADGYYLLHNHPSGDVTMSFADALVTEQYHQYAPGLRGHIIIDHDTYNLLSYKDRDKTIEQGIAALPESARGDVYAREQGLLGKQHVTPSQTAKIFAAIETDADKVTVLYSNPRNELNAIQSVPYGIFNHYKPALDYLRGQARRFGATRVIIGVHGFPTADSDRGLALDRLFEEGHILAGFDLDNMTSILSPKANQQDERFFGAEVKGRVVRESQPPEYGPKQLPVKALSPEVERRRKAAHGVTTLTMTERIRETLRVLGHRATRAYQHLPNTDEFAVVNEVLRLFRGRIDELLLKTQEEIADVLSSLKTPEEKDTFEWYLIMLNMHESVRKFGEPLRSGYESIEELEENLITFRNAVARSPAIQQALNKRKRLLDVLGEMLKEYGILKGIDRKQYYHQQVLTKLKLRRGLGGRKLRRMKRGFQKKRVKGESLPEEYDYNTDYIQAESEWMVEAMVEVEKEKALRMIGDRYDRLDELKAGAKAMNFEALVGGPKVVAKIRQLRGAIRGLQETAREEGRGLNRDEKARAVELSDELWELDPTMPYRQRLAMFINMIQREYDKGAIELGEFDDLVVEEDDLSLDTGSDQWFSFVNYLIMRYGDQKAGIAAKGIFKALNDKRKMVQDRLGDKYLGWDDLIPNGYEPWQSVSGNMFFPVYTIPAAAVENLERSGIFPGLSRDQIKTVIAMGGPHKAMVLPTEIVHQLNAMGKPTANEVERGISRNLMGHWKQWTLMNPKRGLGYNARNFTGDLDPLIAAAPGALRSRYVVPTVDQLWAFYRNPENITEELELSRDLCVISSSMTRAEIPDIKNLALFKRFYTSQTNAMTIVSDYFDFVKKWTMFRENLLRHAAFLYYRDQFKQGNLIHYGGANPRVVEALRRDLGDDIAAAHMARNLLGDYRNLTELGDVIRQHWYPFWSWQEINMGRTYRLIGNSYVYGKAKEKTGAVAGAVGKTVATTAFRTLAMSRILWLYGAMWFWNHLMFPDEEDELSSWERATPHIIFGRNPDGSIRLLRSAGALGDVLEVFGINEIIEHYPKYANNQITLGELAKQAALAPVKKVVFGIRPDVKTVMEVVTGMRLFPEPTRPKAISRIEAAAGFLGLAEEARAVRGLAKQTGETVKADYFARNFIGVSQPRLNAYYATLELKTAYRKTVLGKETKGIFPPSKIRNMKWAAINDNYKAFLAAKKKYVGEENTVENFKRSLLYIDPLYGLSDTDRKRFMRDFLTPTQREMVEESQKWARELHTKLETWWGRDKVKGEGVAQRRQTLRGRQFTRPGRSTTR